MAYLEATTSLMRPGVDRLQTCASDNPCQVCFEEKTTIHRRSRHIPQLLQLTYTIAITLLAAVLFAQNILQRRRLAPAVTSGGSHRPFPEVPTIDVVWEDQPEFSDPDLFQAFVNGSSTGSAWESLHLKDNFWLQLPVDAEIGLTGGLPPRYFNSDSMTTEAFAPALHHQLHCVYLLKIFVSGMETPKVAPEHASHCLELIRQAVVCLGDMSLEKPAHIGDDGWQGITGWGTSHVCKDWSTIDAIVSRHGIKEENICARGCVKSQEPIRS